MIRKTVCGSCGADNAPEGARFCPNCGRSLSEGRNDSDAVPMAAATPLINPNTTNNNIPQLTGTSIEDTVDAVRVTYDETTPMSSVTTTSATTTTTTNNPHASAAASATMSGPPPPTARNTSIPSNDIPATTATASAVPSTPFFNSCLGGGDTGSSTFYSSHNTHDAGRIECANYFKKPSPEMVQRSKLQAMGGVLFVALDCKRNGKFTLAESISVGRILGDVKIDLSIADFVHPITTITVGAILGGLRVTVPRGVRVETQGLGILGSFRGLRDGQTVHAGQDAPLILIRGLSILAGVKVQVNQSVPPLRIVE